MSKSRSPERIWIRPGSVEYSTLPLNYNNDDIEYVRADIASVAPSPLQTDTGVREALAALSHDQWAGWMKYMFSKCGKFVPPFSYIIPRELVERWTRQMNTPYAELPENEKQSDRVEAERMLAVIVLAPLGSSGRRIVESVFGQRGTTPIEGVAGRMLDQLEIVIDSALTAARSEALEQAAKVAGTHDFIHGSGFRCAEGNRIAEKIRALAHSEKGNSNE